MAQADVRQCKRKSQSDSAAFGKINSEITPLHRLHDFKLVVERVGIKRTDLIYILVIFISFRFLWANKFTGVYSMCIAHDRI
ncbi:hypothetical protein OTK50_07995 [Bacillus sp. NEAU-CP5]|uniref:hypothetical protein n=1 Tax=Bacillus TaxID=1386 RepID=UPI00100EF0CF|nr:MULTISPECIES: hypothetical protein [Bacillus]MCX3305157.1 hypothetical protein [Bacillus velezensis]MCX8439757.1 hypothetical protein [Bacillus sp. NEAU-CP5]MDQ8056207.1 hypothetical protein [Bacillus velezensis]QEQ04189.1 hypothetical protein ETZ92_007835 [Bacillus velezensis]ULH21466.1 hypothetical protein MF598_07345 [Bacillus velezensis]